MYKDEFILDGYYVLFPNILFLLESRDADTNLWDSIKLKQITNKINEELIKIQRVYKVFCVLNLTDDVSSLSNLLQYRN